MDDGEVANISDETAAIGIAGPKSSDVLLAAGLEVPDLKPLQFAEISGPQIRLTLARGDNPQVKSFELWVEPRDTERVHEALLKAGSKLVGTAALEQLRIAAGIPRYG